MKKETRPSRPRKLTFTRETIKKLNEVLTQEQLREVAGGWPDTSSVKDPC